MVPGSQRNAHSMIGTTPKRKRKRGREPRLDRLRSRGIRRSSRLAVEDWRARAVADKRYVVCRRAAAAAGGTEPILPARRLDVEYPAREQERRRRRRRRLGGGDYDSPGSGIRHDWAQACRSPDSARNNKAYREPIRGCFDSLRPSARGAMHPRRSAVAARATALRLVAGAIHDGRCRKFCLALREIDANVEINE